MQTFTKATTIFTLYAMTSAMRMHTYENNTGASEFIESFIKEFVGDAYTPELQARFTSRVQSEIMGLQNIVEHVIGETGAQELMDIIMIWPAYLSELTDETNEKFDAFNDFVDNYENAATLEAIFTSQLEANPENTAINRPKGIETLLAQVQDGTETCWKNANGRGNGYGRSYCPEGKELHQGLCYAECEEGYLGVGPVCWQKCPENYKNRGAICMKPNSRKDECPNDMPDLIWSCAKRTNNRGTGSVPECNPGDDAEGVCYPKCDDGFTGVGSVCWQQCKKGQHQCGALCQADGERCGDLVFKTIRITMETIVKCMGNPDFMGCFKEIIDAAEGLNYEVCTV